MDLLLLAIGFIAGGMLPVQVAVNTQLNALWSHHAALTAFISFLAGTLALGAYLLAARVPLPALAGQTAPWHWLGGVLGAAYVATTVMLTPRIGVTALMALALAGQFCVSLFLDHYALIGLVERSISWQRILGVVLVFAGAYLVRKF